LLCVLPLAGLLAYAGVWKELLRYSTIDWSTWTRSELFANWLLATTRAYLLLVPLAIGGFCAGCLRLRDIRQVQSGGEVDSFPLAVLLLCGFATAVLLFPKVPFPRTLVPFLPIWFCAFAFLVVDGLSAVRQQRARAGWLAGVAGAGLLVLAAQPLPPCESARSAAGGRSYDLCYLPFHDGYAPDKVILAWEALRAPDLPIVSDYEAFYALRVLNAEDAGMRIYEYRHFPGPGGAAPLIVAHDPEELQRIADGIGADLRRYRKFADTGYFDLYVPQ
jgi:hypothetical protein